MTGDALPDDHHFGRLVSPSQIQDGIVSGAAFLLRERDTGGLSGHWLEKIAPTLDKQLAGIRGTYARKRMNVRANHRIAILEVGVSIAAAALVKRAVSFVHDPEARDEYGVDDPYHALLLGMEIDDVEVADTIATSVQLVSPAQ